MDDVSDFINDDSQEDHPEESRRVKPPGKKKLPPNRPTGIITHPMCKSCAHPARATIDKLCVTPNISYREIARMFGLNFSGVANHAKKHITYEQAAIREIIADEAARQNETVAAGVKGVAAQNVFLRSYLQKTTEKLLADELQLSGKEAMSAIEMLRAADEENYGIQLAKLTRQYEAITTAMREIVPPDTWYKVIDRAEDIFNKGIGNFDPVVVDAVVVESNEPQQVLHEILPSE